MNIIEDAKKIAKLIAETQTEKKGDLLIEVANQLAKRTQHYTSSIIYRAGEIYNQE